jgi:hypothetical protein
MLCLSTPLSPQGETNAVFVCIVSLAKVRDPGGGSVFTILQGLPFPGGAKQRILHPLFEAHPCRAVGRATGRKKTTGTACTRWFNVIKNVHAFSTEALKLFCCHDVLFYSLIK